MWFCLFKLCSGSARNVYFPFDIASDTPLDVATEMVKELEITDWEPFEIADMIDEEISALIPNWKKRASLNQITGSIIRRMMMGTITFSILSPLVHHRKCHSRGLLIFTRWIQVLNVVIGSKVCFFLI